MPRRDGPYVILTQRSPSSYEIASLDNPGEPLGVYHTSALTPCTNDKVKLLIPLRNHGRPPKVPQTPGSSSGSRSSRPLRGLRSAGLDDEDASHHFPLTSTFACEGSMPANDSLFFYETSSPSKMILDGVNQDESMNG
ncbi:hypothetical protein TNCV_62291 [Trichonephila clavipes]|nr:hypothetical protein TNCV_62291 [Trichonephila clavipes]